VVERLQQAGHHTPGDADILVVFDAGYDVTRLAHLLADLPVELLGRVRSDRTFHYPPSQRQPGRTGRSARHGPEFKLDRPDSQPEADTTTASDTSRYGTAEACAWPRLHPRNPPQRMATASGRATDHRGNRDPPDRGSSPR
jgi:hypothetical protein